MLESNGKHKTNETLSQHIRDDAVLAEICRQVSSQIDVRQQEMDRLFDRLRADVEFTFFGNVCHKRDPCDPLHESVIHANSVTRQTSTAGKQNACSNFMPFCRTQVAADSQPQENVDEVPPLYEVHGPSEQVPQEDEAQSLPVHGGGLGHVEQPVQALSVHAESPTQAADMQEDPVTPSADAVVPDANGGNQNDVPTADEEKTGQDLSHMANMETEGSESIKSEQGHAVGAFHGRGNMFAFLQAKNWDSDYAQEPEKETAHLDEIAASDTRSPQWKKFEDNINSTQFDLIIGSVILANSIVMGLQLEYDAIQSAASIGIEPDEGNWPSAEDAFLALEHVFAIIYLLELFMRLLVMHCTYFKHTLNWLDFTIVSVSVIELYIIPAAGMESPDLGIIRLLRVTRIVRVLRMVRVLKLVPKLRVLVVAITHSIWSLVWSLILLGLVQLIASVFITQSLQSFLQDEEADPAVRKTVYLYFGSFSRSCITMFEITLAVGTWGRCGRVVIFSVSRYYAFFFLGYMGLVSFAMMRVIAAIFLKDTLASAAKDSDIAMCEEHKDPYYVKRLWAVFNQLDEGGNGSVHLGELAKALQNNAHIHAFKSLGVVPHEVLGLFTLMDDGDDEISFCEFLTGVMRLKNANKGVDLATLLYENKKLLKRVLAVGDKVEKVQDSLAASLLAERKTLRIDPPPMATRE